MLAVIVFMGIGLLEWYLFSIALSFCITMMGNTYLKNSGAISENFNCYIPTAITSLVPLFNVVYAIQTLRVGILTWRDPESRDLYKNMFSKMEKMAKGSVGVKDTLLKMSRDQDEDEDGDKEDDKEE